jgi:hypothetical protein
VPESCFTGLHIRLNRFLPITGGDKYESQNYLSPRFTFGMGTLREKGKEKGCFSADEYIEKAIRSFLEEQLKIGIKYLQ